MKLLFLDCSPSKSLQEALEFHKLKSEYAAQIEQCDRFDPEILIWKLPNIESLKDLARLRSIQPRAWIALVIADSWLNNPANYSALLASSEKDDIWLETQWESGFWLGLQRAVQSRASKNREQTLQAELEKIKTEQEKLVETSAALIQQFEKDTATATEVHRKFYPRFSPDVPGVEVLSKYLPASGKGGDYFDLFEYGDKRKFALLLADSESHRVAASLLSAILKVRLDDLKSKFADSTSFIQHLSESVRAESPKSQEALNLLYGVFDRATLQIEFTAAGDFSPKLWRKNKWLDIDTKQNAALLEGMDWRSTQVALEPGDCLLFFSDGLLSALAPTLGGLEACLERLQMATDPLDLRNQLIAEVERARAHSPLSDDLTFILLGVDPAATFLRSVRG